MKTQFEFRSTKFNCTKVQDYFINPNCYGDDVCRFLIDSLTEQGVATDASPSQEDYGWYFNFRVAQVEHCLIVGFQPNDPSTGDAWLGWIERRVGFLSSIMGGRNKGILNEAVAAVDLALRSSADIRDLQWCELEG